MRRLRVVWILLLVIALLGLGLGGAAVYTLATRQPLPWAGSCTARANGESVRLEDDQLRNAAVIAGVAARRGLNEGAVTIALATALQESGLRNLDYGDRDSVGLFQQRPSQGWGTAAQIMDPHYAANAFFAAMEKVSGWSSKDVGDVAQEVQRSGYPDAYDKHIPMAGTLAAVLTGAAPAGLTCGLPDLGEPDPAGLAKALAETLPTTSKVSRSGDTLTITAPSARAAWSAAAIAVAEGTRHGLRVVETGGRTWRHSWPLPSSWSDAASEDTKVRLRFG